MTFLPSNTAVFKSLLRADLTTQWRNRRASMMVILVPCIILVSWKSLVDKIGAANVLSNCITVGLTAIGLMGYTNSIARDREKGIFQRLRVAPASNWNIMASRLAVQLLMILIVTIVVFIVGKQVDGINISLTGYLTGFCMAIIGGAVYLALGQIIVGLIKNPEMVNATARLVYFAFIVIGMFGGLGMLGDFVKDLTKYSPYGTVKMIVAAGLQPETWNNESWIALLMTLGYTIVFAIFGIKWFRWSNR
nr:ABC transporter permease [Nostoc sp. PA-18-2419]